MDKRDQSNYLNGILRIHRTGREAPPQSKKSGLGRPLGSVPAGVDAFNVPGLD